MKFGITIREAYAALKKPGIFIDAAVRLFEEDSVHVSLTKAALRERLDSAAAELGMNHRTNIDVDADGNLWVE